MTDIQMIPLNDLNHSPLNVRQTDAMKGIPELAESIKVHGLLQNLQVVEAKHGYEVIAGGRRLSALKYLAEQKEITIGFPVPCIVVPPIAADEKAITGISLAENEMRQAMHPADQFTAFKKLADAGDGNETIAAHFGVTPRVVEQRLKLAVVSPKLIAAYRKSELTLDHLMAFAVSDSHKQQEKVWKEIKGQRGFDADDIRGTLTEKHIQISTNREAKFIGADDYEAAGGQVVRDLFDDQSAGYMTDAALLKKLVAEKLETLAESVRAEGWKWVEVIPDFGWEQERQYETLKASFSAETKAKIEELEKELSCLDYEDPGDEELIGDIQAQIDDLQRYAKYTEADKAKAGAIISIGHNGPEIRRGMMSRDDQKATRKEAAKAGTSEKPKKAEDKGLSQSLVEDLTSQRTVAMQLALSKNPKVALIALVHRMMLRIVLDEYSFGHPVTIAVKREVPKAETAAKSDERKQLDAAIKALAKGMPDDEVKLWAWLAKKDQKALLDMLAVCVAATIDAVLHKDPVDDGQGTADCMAEALKLDMTKHWQPTANGYFSRVSQKQILDAITEGVGKKDAAELANRKKGDLARIAEQKLKGKGWLPEILRS